MISVYRQTMESIKYLYSKSTQVRVFVLDNVVMCLCCLFPRYIVRVELLSYFYRVTSVPAWTLPRVGTEQGIEGEQIRAMQLWAAACNGFKCHHPITGESRECSAVLTRPRDCRITCFYPRFSPGFPWLFWQAKQIYVNRELGARAVYRPGIE